MAEFKPAQVWPFAVGGIASAAAAVAIPFARGGGREAGALSRGFVCQPEAGQRHAGEPDAEFLQRLLSRHGLGHALCEFIEFRVHVCVVLK